MNDKAAILLSISIVSYFSPEEELKRLLKSLAYALAIAGKRGLHITAALQVVDNRSSNFFSDSLLRQLAPELDTIHCPVRVIAGQGNIGYGRGHNLALESSATKYHLFLNPDIELDENSLWEGIDFLESRPDTVMLSPYASDRNGNKQYLCKRYPSVLTFLIRGFFPPSLKKHYADRLASFEMHELAENRANDDIPIISGCCMLCRTDALKQIGGFDPAYFLYFEDFDLSLRAAALGKLVYLPAMKIVHHGGQSARKGLKHIAFFIRSGIRFFNTWGWRFIQ